MLSNPGITYPVRSLSSAGVKLLDCEHRTPKSLANGFPYIAIPDIQNGQISLANVRLISKADYESWTRKTNPQPGDIIMTRRGRVGDTAVVPKGLECAIGQDLVILRSDGKQVLQKFLRWALRGPLYDREVQKYLNVGAIFYSLNCGDIPKFEIPIPSISEQSAISDMLDSLDLKIQLDQKMNRTLEAIGQAFFKRWFVDFEFPNEEGKPYKSSGGEMVNSSVGEIPRGWAIGGLGDICDITMGQSPPGETYNETEEGLPFFQGVRDFGFRFPSRRIYCTEPTRFAQAGDVLLSVRAPVGSLNVAEERSVIGRGVAALRLKGKQNGFLYYLLLATRSGWDKYESEGTVFGSATKQDVFDFKIVIPSKNLRDQFGDLIEPLDKRIFLNELESRNLTVIRDSLLPRLMSGKIRVPILKENVEVQ
jgi:type I restriction enzyme S subunit